MNKFKSFCLNHKLKIILYGNLLIVALIISNILLNSTCPIIVEYMNDRFDKKLLQYIQDNEGNGMKFLAEYYDS